MIPEIARTVYLVLVLKYPFRSNRKDPAVHAGQQWRTHRVPRTEHLKETISVRDALQALLPDPRTVLRRRQWRVPLGVSGESRWKPFVMSSLEDVS